MAWGAAVPKPTAGPSSTCGMPDPAVFARNLCKPLCNPFAPLCNSFAAPLQPSLCSPSAAPLQSLCDPFAAPVLPVGACMAAQGCWRTQGCGREDPKPDQPVAEPAADMPQDTLTPGMGCPWYPTSSIPPPAGGQAPLSLPPAGSRARLRSTSSQRGSTSLGWRAPIPLGNGSSPSPR